MTRFVSAVNIVFCDTLPAVEGPLTCSLILSKRRPHLLNRICQEYCIELLYGHVSHRGSPTTAVRAGRPAATGALLCYLSMVLQPFFGPWLLFSFLILYKVGRTPWTGISPSQGRYLHTEQHKHRINAHRHPCLEWDSNPRSQCSSGRREFMPWTARPQ
jgi:hypothetical protein